MTEAERRPARLAWSALLLGLFAVLALLVHTAPGLFAFDAKVGSWPQRVTYQHHGFFEVWRWIGRATSTIPETVVTVVVVLTLWAKGHRRAALWTAGVMATSGVAVVVLKQLVGRDRPVWDDPVLVLNSYSFPSGHATGIASAAGVAIVLTTMLVRRRAVRRLVSVLAVLVALVVGADRIFLGVHNLSDVVGGYLLGAGIVMVWLALYDPTPALDRAGQRAADRGRAGRAPAARRGAQPGEDRRRRSVPRAGRDAGPRRRVLLRDLVGDHRRGHRARHGARSRCQRRRPGDRHRRRRHHPGRVRGAGRHRHPGRHRARRHRQPAGAQPRDPALPPLRGRRGPQRPGPRHRHGPRSAATTWRTPPSW